MRNIVADRLKSFLMFLVLLGHVIYFWNGSFYFNSGLYANNIIAELIRTVQMPCFMIVSGFFFNKAVNKYSFISRQYKRTILFRYIISDLVVIFTWSNLYFCSKGILNVNIRYYIDFLRTSFWFFWVLLFLKITFTFIHYVGKDSIIWVIILFAP